MRQQARPRPYVTHYFTEIPERSRYATNWHRIGRAVTLQNAARAAVMHLIDGRHVYAVLHHPSGEVAGYAERVDGRIRLIGV